jgi:hypothetical protein
MRTGRAVRVRIGTPISVSGRDLEGLMQEVQDFLVQNVEKRGQNEASTGP